MVSGAILQQPEALVMSFCVSAPDLTIQLVDLVIFPENKLQQEHEVARALFHYDPKSVSQRETEYITVSITEKFS